MFVHGLFGHPRDTWTSASSDATAARPISSSNTATGATAEKKRDTARRFWHKATGKGKGRAQIDEQRIGNSTAGSVLPSESQSSGQEYKEPLFWPKDILPEVIADTRIYTWGYDVDINHIFSSASQATVFQHAASLLSDLADERISAEDVNPSLLVSSTIRSAVPITNSLCLRKLVPLYSLPIVWEV